MEAGEVVVVVVVEVGFERLETPFVVTALVVGLVLASSSVAAPALVVPLGPFSRTSASVKSRSVVGARAVILAEMEIKKGTCHHQSWE